MVNVTCVLTVFSGTPHRASKSSYRRERVSGVFLPRNSLCLCLYPDKLTLSYLIICIPYCRLGDLISARLFAVFVRMSLTAERVTLPSGLSFFLVAWFWITDFSRCFWGLVCLVGLQTWVLCEIFLKIWMRKNDEGNGCWKSVCVLQKIGRWFRTYPQDIFGGRFVRGVQRYISNRWADLTVPSIIKNTVLPCDCVIMLVLSVLFVDLSESNFLFLLTELLLQSEEHICWVAEEAFLQIFLQQLR